MTTEVFIPTYELVLAQRSILGEPTGRSRYYQATSPAKLASFFASHRRKNPLPKSDKRKFEDAKV